MNHAIVVASDRVSAVMRRSRAPARSASSSGGAHPGNPNIVKSVLADALAASLCAMSVRRWSSWKTGGAANAVDDAKQARIRALAAAWLAEQSAGGEVDVRFDVIAIEGVTLTHLRAAF